MPESFAREPASPAHRKQAPATVSPRAADGYAGGMAASQAEPNDATPFVPEARSLEALREAAGSCRGCHLWRGATQTVFGAGRLKARAMFVGEQPGDQEDRRGSPFVGTAGRELDTALEAVGIDR